jgi:type II secretion system protein C
LISRAAWLARLPSVTLLAALVLLTWVLARWTWVFVTPRPPTETTAAAPLLSKMLAEKAAAFRLFGSERQAAPGPASAPVAAVSNIVVRGIYAARDGRSGFAVLVLDGRTVEAVSGKEVAPGVVLHRVYPDRVEIQRNGQIEIARLAPLANGAAAAGPVAGNPATSGGAPALQVAVRELAPGRFGLSRAQMLATLKRPDQLALLGRYAPHPRGGVVLEQSPAGGLPSMLGLKVGDVVTGINGKALAGSGDVMRVYEQLVQSESVNVAVLRAGVQMNLGIQVAP